jgi:alginate O-acetyltransferase complex protein AlgI
MQALFELLQTYVPGSSYAFSFHSWPFLALFAVLVFALGLSSSHPVSARIRVGLLLAFSLYFFARIGGWFVLVMVASAFIDFRVGLALLRTTKSFQRKLLVGISLVANLGLLAYFKYTPFFVQVASQLSGAELVTPEIIIPVVSLSFYSFRSIGYVLDVDREMLDEPERRFDHYLLYVGCFANVLAGPISRATDFLPQLYQPYQLSKADAGRALYLIVGGMFKKIAIADYLAENFVNRVFDAPLAFTGLESLLAGVAYVLQLFFDFGGYTDMAVGLALLCGLQIQHNFNEPFKSRSLTDFWRRWHITMSTWFNEYVYVPLSFRWRTSGRWGAALAVLLTFTLSGLWHGAGYTFIVWGLLQGLGLSLEIITRAPRKWLEGKIGMVAMRVLAAPLLAAFVWLSFLVFRSRDLETAAAMLSQIGASLHPELVADWAIQYRYPALIMLLGLLLAYFPTAWKSEMELGFAQTGWLVQGLLIFVALLVVYQFRTAGLQPFVYLQF